MDKNYFNKTCVESKWGKIWLAKFFCFRLFPLLPMNRINYSTSISYYVDAIRNRNRTSEKIKSLFMKIYVIFLKNTKEGKKKIVTST